MTVNSSLVMDSLADNVTEETTNEKTFSETKRKQYGFRIKKMCFTFFVGQLLAVLMSGVFIFTGLLRQAGYNLSLSQNVGHYALLLVVSIFLPFCRSNKRHLDEQTIARETAVVKYRTLLYVVVAVIDSHGSWAILEAYTYTSITSVQLLNCVALPVVMLFSFFLLNHRYRWNHYLSAVLSIVGAAMMVFTDSILHKSSSSSYRNVTHVPQKAELSNQKTPTYLNNLFGDFLAVFGALLLGLSNVIQEFLITQYGYTPYLIYVSLSGTGISLFYFLLVELVRFVELTNYGSIASVVIPASTAWYYIGYVVSQCLMYIIMSRTIHSVNALFINLSFVASDFYALLAGIFIFHNQLHYFYFISFFVIVVGILCYFVEKPYFKPLIPDTEKEIEVHN